MIDDNYIRGFRRDSRWTAEYQDQFSYDHHYEGFRVQIVPSRVTVGMKEHEGLLILVTQVITLRMAALGEEPPIESELVLGPSMLGLLTFRSQMTKTVQRTIRRALRKMMDTKDWVDWRTFSAEPPTDWVEEVKK